MQDLAHDAETRTDPNSSEARVALNAGTGYANRLLSLAIRFFLTPFLGRAVGATMMGLVTLSGQVLQFVAMASSAIIVSYNRIAAEYSARGEYGRMNATLSAGFLLACLSAAIYTACTVLMVVFTEAFLGLPPELVPVTRTILAITGVAAVVHMLYGVWLSPVFITQRQYLRSIAEAVAIVGSAACVVIAFKTGNPSIVVWVLLMAGFRVGTEVLLIIPLARRALPQMRVDLRLVTSMTQLRRVISFGGLSFLGGVGYLLYYATDSIVISNLNELETSQIFYYNIAQRWDPVIRSLLMAFVSVLTPLMTSDLAIGNEDRVRRTLLRGTRYALTMGLFPCIVLITLGYAFIESWMHADYAPVSHPVLCILMTGFLVGIPGLVAFELLFAKGHIGRAVVATVIGGILNIGLSVAFVKYAGLGLRGIALGSTLTLGFVSGIYMPYLAARALSLNPLTYVRHALCRALAAGVLLLGVCLGMKAAWQPVGLRGVFAQFAVCGLVYAVIVWAIGFTRADHQRVRNMLVKGQGMLNAWRGKT